MLVLCQVLLALVVCLFVAHYLKLQWSRGRFPPGPTPLPIIGNLWTLRFKLHPETLMQLAKTYGNIFTVWLGQNPMIVLNGCQAVRNGLISHSEELSGRPTTPIFEAVSRGKGVVFSSGHNWKQQRRFGIKTMRNLGLGKKSLQGRICDEAQLLVEIFALTKGTPMDPSPAIVHSVTNVIAAVVFGHRFSSEDEAFHQFIEANHLFTSVLGSMWARLYDAFPWLMRHLPGPHQNLFKMNAYLEVFVNKEVKSHKENGIPEEPEDLIDHYLAQIIKDSDDATSMYDEDNMIRLVLELFGAGMETTATTLLWALLHMVNQPDIQDKVQKELDAVFGESQIIEYEDRKRLPYTNAVIHEIQRFSNVGSIGLLRQVIKDTTLQGFHVEKGTILVANLSSSLYDPEHWETPRQFNPGHFLDQEGNFVTREAFLPFSAGHRVCLGELLARNELFIFFTSLLRAFTFRLPKGLKEVNMDYIFGATLHPHPFKICVLPRELARALE